MFQIKKHLLPEGWTGNREKDATAQKYPPNVDSPVNHIVLDFETTGLDTLHDHILEIAAHFVTSKGIVEKSFDTVVGAPFEVLNRITDPWILTNHKVLIEKSKDPNIALPFYSLDQLLYTWLSYFGSTEEKPTITLIGNSVWFDRAFLTRLMPNSLKLLSYRQIDVSSVELFFKNSFGTLPGELVFEKKKVHRSREDVMETLQQYRHFLRYMELGRKAMPPVMIEKIFRILMYYGNMCTYEAPRTGGVLQGCPRGAPPRPDELVFEARNMLRDIVIHLNLPVKDWTWLDDYATPPPPQTKAYFEKAPDFALLNQLVDLIMLTENGDGFWPTNSMALRKQLGEVLYGSHPELSNVPAQPLTEVKDSASPDDIEAKGWKLMLHTEHLLYDNREITWVFMKDRRYVRGSGYRDDIALNLVREAINDIEKATAPTT